MKLRKLNIESTVAVVIVLLANVLFAAEVRKDIPAAIWEPIYFETIDKVATRAGIVSLRETVLRKDELQVRLWAGFGLGGLKGLIIERVGGTWHACYLQEDHSEYGLGTVLKKDVKASCPWPQLWDKTTKLGLLTLADEDTLKPDGIRTLDGICYVVEFQANGVYRTYMYDNPGDHKWPESAKLSQIVMLFSKALSIPLYSAPTTYPDTVKDRQVVLVRKGKAWGAFQLFDQRMSGNDRPLDTASVNWVYRTDGKSELTGAGVITGQLEVKGSAPIVFGPFSIKWSSAGDGRGYIYYPDADGTNTANLDREYLTITDLNKIDKLNAADARWDYKASYIELPEDH